MDYKPTIPAMPDMDFSGIQRRQEELAGRNDAEGVYKYLVTKTRQFQFTLADDEEIGVQLANFGVAASLHIRGIGYRNPNLIEFMGIDQNGDEVTLVQHISQLNFLLVAMKPVEDTPYRIGFRQA